jgi:cupin superfamily acireductone dioxygenase involved in methionine salvage
MTETEQTKIQDELYEVALEMWKIPFEQPKSKEDAQVKWHQFFDYLMKVYGYGMRDGGVLTSETWIEKLKSQGIGAIDDDQERME